MTRYYYEDLPVGRTITGGSYRVSEAEIVEFARAYDPQPMHTDPAAAEGTPIGTLIASGLHLIAICGRLSVDLLYADAANVAGLGIEGIEFVRPVHPGDVLELELAVADSRVSESDPSRGIVTIDRDLRNQDGETVLTMTGVSLFERRSG